MHGVLNHRVQWDLLHDVAERLPRWSFVLVGPVRAAPGAARLQALPNVRFLGAKPRAELPRLIRTFDVGLLPYTHSPMNLACSPLKLYDYLTAGVPAVSTSLPQARKLSPPLLIADDAETFAQALEQAYARHDALAADCVRVAHDHTWKVRGAEVARILDQLARAP